MALGETARGFEWPAKYVDAEQWRAEPVVARPVVVPMDEPTTMEVQVLPWPWYPGMDPALGDMIGPVVVVSRLSDRRTCWIPEPMAEDDAAFRFAMEVL